MADSQGEHAFDYVIAGAGTAGCVLANRLSEDPSNRVCLIEAGGKDSHPFIHVPALVGAALTLKQLSWGLETVPQANLNGRRIPVPRGRVLGRLQLGQRHGLFPAATRRTMTTGRRRGTPAGRSPICCPISCGPRTTRNIPARPSTAMTGRCMSATSSGPIPLNAVFADAMRSLQFRHCDDFNGPEPEGYGLRQGAIRNGRRESGVTAFLKPAIDRPN